jgi:hypothetical protein
MCPVHEFITDFREWESCRESRSRDDEAWAIAVLPLFKSVHLLQKRQRVGAAQMLREFAAGRPSAGSQEMRDESKKKSLTTPRRCITDYEPKRV